uniref:Cyclin-dependent kinase 17-like n=1 Tax=Paramormyrops kingsleyae TaxID=1676925 RepID=A0A3B3SVL0_9TELE|nr:cyclin-dependent kinase 17-like [Paramormyrops kingsleyae]
MEKMKKFKRRLSLTLRGSQTIDESLSELAEQMTIEESSSKDNEPMVRNGRPPTSHSMHSFLHQYTGSFRKPPLRRPHSVIGGSLGSFMAMPRNGSRLDIVHENLKIGSDGESDHASGTSSDEVQSPTGVCLRNRVHRRISMEVGVCMCSPVHGTHTVMFQPSFQLCLGSMILFFCISLIFLVMFLLCWLGILQLLLQC